MNDTKNERDAAIDKCDEPAWKAFIEVYCGGGDITDRSDWIPFKIGYDAASVSAATAETQKKLDSARAALEHYANEDHWRWDRDEDLNAYMATDHGPLIARKWLDAEQGGGE